MSLANFYETNKEQLDDTWKRVMGSGNYILGDEVGAFERRFSKYIGTKYGVGVANGTDAIELALAASGVRQGKVVLTVSFTAVATVAAILRSGATPFFIDIDENYGMCPVSLEKGIRYCRQNHLKVEALVLVHLYGQSVDLDSILSIAEKEHLIVIEDCAQAHGATFKGKKLGTFGTFSTFSFYPTKNLGAFGDGGMVLTNNRKFSEKLYQLRQYGWTDRYVSEEVGMNSRLDELQAALLNVRLSYLDKENDRRNQIAKLYREWLSPLAITLPAIRDFSYHVFHLFVIRVRNRDALLRYLRQKNILASIHYPLPVHLQPAYQSFSQPDSQLRNTEAFSKEIMSLPIHPSITNSEVESTCEFIKEWFLSIGCAP